MATAVLLIDDLGPHRARCIAFLAKRFSLSLLEVRRSVEDGKPIVARKLFDRQDPPFAEILVEALAQLEALACSYRAFEIPDGEIWSSSEIYYELTVERLRNIIAAHRSSLERQRRSSELEDPADT